MSIAESGVYRQPWEPAKVFDTGSYYKLVPLESVSPWDKVTREEGVVQEIEEFLHTEAASTESRYPPVRLVQFEDDSYHVASGYEYLAAVAGYNNSADQAIDKIAAQIVRGTADDLMYERLTDAFARGNILPARFREIAMEYIDIDPAAFEKILTWIPEHLTLERGQIIHDTGELIKNKQLYLNLLSSLRLLMKSKYLAADEMVAKLTK